MNGGSELSLREIPLIPSIQINNLSKGNARSSQGILTSAKPAIPPADQHDSRVSTTKKETNSNQAVCRIHIVLAPKGQFSERKFLLI